MLDYTGKTIFIGLDVHKKTYAVTAICDGVVVKRDSIKAYPTVLISYLKKRFGTGTIKSAYEAGFSGFYLHRELVAAGIINIVVHAASIEVSNDRVKTDKRDSLKIATHLSQGRLKGIHVPTVEREDYRAVTRLRDAFVREKLRLGNQIKALLHQHGLIAPDNKKKVCLSWIKDLSKLEMTPGIKLAVEMHAKMWLEFDAKIKAIEIEIKAQAIKDKVVDQVYRGLRGIGTITARILSNELGDMLHFNNERKIFKYVGFTPCEHSSGEHTRQGHITRQGKPILRKILIQAAWTAIRYDKELQEIYERIGKKSGAKRAIVAVARRIIGRLRACFRTGTPYEMQMVERPTIKLSKQKSDQEKRPRKGGKKEISPVEQLKLAA